MYIRLCDLYTKWLMVNDDAKGKDALTDAIELNNALSSTFES